MYNTNIDDEIYVLPTNEIKHNLIYAKKFYLTETLKMLNGKRNLDIRYIKRYSKIKNILNKVENTKYFSGTANEILEILNICEKVRRFKKLHPNIVFEHPTDYMNNSDYRTNSHYKTDSLWLY